MTAPIEAASPHTMNTYARLPVAMVRGQGCRLWDANGNSYLDGLGGIAVNTLGHAHPRFVNALQEQVATLIHCCNYYHVPNAEVLAAKLTELAHMTNVFFCCTGLEANEAALKLARKVKGRTNVFALMGAFHGMTLGSLALTTDTDSRKGSGVPLVNVTHIPAPGMFAGLDTIEYMQRLIDDDHSGVEKPAALFIETTQAEGGVNVLPTEWLRAARAFCDRNDILLAVDDIQVGCGRAGSFFSFERAGIVPDIVTLSKSIGGYGMPMALALFRPELDIWTPGEHNGTFRGNQLALVAARAGIDYFCDHSIDKEALRKGEIIRSFLEKEVLPLDSRLSVRGIGMIWGIDFSAIDADQLCGKVLRTCFGKKLVIEQAGRKNAVLKIMAALTIEDDLLLEGLGRLRDAIRENL